MMRYTAYTGTADGALMRELRSSWNTTETMPLLGVIKMVNPSRCGISHGSDQETAAMSASAANTASIPAFPGAGEQETYLIVAYCLAKIGEKPT